MNAPIALPDDTYHRLVDDLLHARDEFRIMELIGGVANVWPKSALPDPEPRHPEQHIAASPEIGNRVLKTATAPEITASSANEPAAGSPLAWPPARPRPLKRGAINPPWRTPK